MMNECGLKAVPARVVLIITIMRTIVTWRRSKTNRPGSSRRQTSPRELLTCRPRIRPRANPKFPHLVPNINTPVTFSASECWHGPLRTGVPTWALKLPYHVHVVTSASNVGGRLRAAVLLLRSATYHSVVWRRCWCVCVRTDISIHIHTRAIT